MSRPIVLVGMMGAGKTTVGRILGTELDRPYLDSDAEISRVTGRRIDQLFADLGEPAFRAEEASILRTMIRDTDERGRVISVGGGTVLDPGNRQVLEDEADVVWLRARVQTLTRRVGDGIGRPLLGEEPGVAVRQLYRERRPLYVEVADLVVDVDDIGPQEVVALVITGLADLGCLGVAG